MIQKKNLIILFSSLVLALALVAAPFISALAIDTMPAPLDPQSWRLQRDMTWHDFKANPVIDWKTQLNKDSLDNKFAFDDNDPNSVIVGGLLMFEYLDRKFISRGALGSDPLGYYLFDTDGAGLQNTITQNPVFNVPALIAEEKGISVAEVTDEMFAHWWADYLNKPQEINNGVNIDEFWRENSYGKWAVDLRPYGPFTIPYFEFETMGYDIGSNFQSWNDVPPSFRRSSTYSFDTIAHQLAVDMNVPFGDFDFFFLFHAGYDESGVWQEFGQSQFKTRQDVPYELGPGPRMLTVEKFFTDNPDWLDTYITRYPDAQCFTDAKELYQKSLTDSTVTYEFKLSQADWDWVAGYNDQTQKNTRYVPFTSWEAAVGEWSHAGSYTYQGRRIPRSTQGENDGMAVFAHEFGHISGIADNYGNPWTDGASAATEPWELMSRGSFAGPFGDHARWTVPGIEAGSAPVNFMQRNKENVLFYNDKDVLTLSTQELASGTPLVTEVVARNIPLASVYYPWLEEYGLVSPNFYKAIKLNFGADDWADKASIVTTGFTWTRKAASSVTVEVVDQNGYDSFNHDHGVLLSRTHTNTGNPYCAVIDSHLGDIAMIDYELNDEFAPYPLAHTTQLADATFHAGLSSVDTGYYATQYGEKTGNNPANWPVDKAGSIVQWEERGGRDIVSGDTVNEFYDEANKLHFYILEKHDNPGRIIDGEQQYFLSYTVAVLHDDGVAVGGELKVELVDVEPETPGKVAVAYFDITNTGNAVDIIRAEAKGLDAVLLNNLYAIGAGETVTVPVYFELADDEAALANQTVTFVASSESNSAKTGSAAILGKNLYADKINVSFPGVKGATVKYYTNVAGWVTVGVFDDTAKFAIPDAHKATFGATTVQVLKDGMWYTFSNLNVGEEPLYLKVPLSTVAVTGIDSACDLGIVQEDWVYNYAPAKVGAVNEFKVFDNGKNYEVRLYRAGFYPISITGVAAGQTANFGSAYIYKVYVAQGVSDVWISSYDWAVRGANTGDQITLLMDPNNIRDAKMRYTLDGETYNVEFKLDGSNPFEGFYTVYAKDTPKQSIEKIKAINPDYIIDEQTQPTFNYSGTNNSATNTATIFEEVWIEVPCDTDEDGKRDLIRIQIARPAETGVIIDPLSGETAVSVPVLMEHSPYRNNLSYSYLPNWPVVHDQIVNPSTAGYQYLTDVQTKKPRAPQWDWSLDAKFWDYAAKEWVTDAAGGNPSWYVTPRAGAADAAWFIPESRGSKSVVFQANWPSGSLQSVGATYQYYYTRGYAVVISASLGNAYQELESEGFTNCGDVEETLVCMAIIKWLNGDLDVKGYTDRSATKEVKATWCNGNVAMTGQSYVGTLPQATACSGVDGIKAILPIAAISSWYDYYRGNGAVVAAYNYQGEDADELTDYCFGRRGTASFREANSQDPKIGVADVYEKFLAQMHIDQDRNSGDYSSFWDDRNYLTTIDSVPDDCGVMIMHGLDDWNVKRKQPDQFYRALKDAGKTVKEIWHLGAHATVWDKVDSHYMEYYHLWLDKFLYLLDNNAIEKIPEINMPNSNNVNWEFYDEWPIAGSTRQTWYLNSPTATNAGAFTTGTAPAAATAGTFKDDTVANASLINAAGTTVVNGNLNGWENRLFNPAIIDELSGERLAFATEPLAKPIRLNGTVTVGLELSADKGWGSISAVLVEVGPNYRSFGTANTDPPTILNSGHGTSNITLNNYTVSNTRTDYKIITRGYADVQNPNPAKETYLNAPKAHGYIPAYYYQTQTITPGEKYKYYFEMETMDYTFKAGNRLALFIYSTDYRTTIVPLNPTTFTLYTGADTFLELPIVPTYSIFYDANGGVSSYDALGGYSDTYPIAGQSAKAWEGGYRVVSGVGNTSVVKLNASDVEFLGWNTKADGTGAAYLPGDRIAEDIVAELAGAEGAFTLYAQWAGVTVNLDANGGSGVPATFKLNSSMTIDDLPKPTPPSSTLEFKGWTLDGRFITDEDIANDSLADATLVAHYTLVDKPDLGNDYLNDNVQKFPDMWDFDKQQTKPAFSNDNDRVICEEVWIEVPCDVDGDGQRDLIRARFRRPIETKPEYGGLLTPVLAEVTPYANTFTNLAYPFGGKVDEDFAEDNPDTRNVSYAGIRYDGPTYKDLLAKKFGDLSEYGIPAARVPAGSQIEGAPTANWSALAWQGYFIPLGFTCAHLTIIGSTYGEGFLTYGDYAENLCAASLVDWLNGRLPGYTNPTDNILVESPYWATGEVAMGGQSYNGTLPFAAAITGVEGLKTIIPFAPVTSSYEYYRANGVVYAPGGWQGEDVSFIVNYCFGRGFQGWNANPPTPASPVYPTPQVWERYWDYIGECYNSEDRKSGDYSEWWDGRNQVSFMTDIAELNPDLSMILFHGFTDYNVKFKQTALAFEMAKELGITAKAIFHQGPHTSPYNHNGLDFFPDLHKWFDHYLYGVNNGMPNDFPDVRVQSNVDIAWREYDTWPVGDYQKFYLKGADRVGTISTSAPSQTTALSFKDELLLDLDRGEPTYQTPANPIVPNYAENAQKYLGRVNTMASSQFYRWRNMLLGGEDVATAWSSWIAPVGMIFDLTKPVNDRLLYVMNVTEDMTISGTIKMTAKVKADKKGGVISAMLVDYGSELRYGTGTTNTGTVILPNGVSANLVSWSQNADPTPAKIISRGSVDVQNPNYDGDKIWIDYPEQNWMANYTFQTTAITTDTYYPYTWELDVTEYTVLAGHQLGLILFGSDPEYTARPFNPTEFTVEIGPETYLSLPLVDPYQEEVEGAVTVNFPGVEGVTVQYWTGFWTTVPGIYDDTCTFEVPEGATITSVLAMKGGMWYQQDGLSWNSDSTIVFDVPVSTITVTGIGGACNLGLAQEDWVYRSAAAVVDQVIVYPVFDNAKKYIVHLNLPGAPTILIPDIAAGATVDLSEYF